MVREGQNSAQKSHTCCYEQIQNRGSSSNNKGKLWGGSWLWRRRVVVLGLLDSRGNVASHRGGVQVVLLVAAARGGEEEME